MYQWRLLNCCCFSVLSHNPLTMFFSAAIIALATPLAASAARLSLPVRAIDSGAMSLNLIVPAPAYAATSVVYPPAGTADILKLQANLFTAINIVSHFLFFFLFFSPSRNPDDMILRLSFLDCRCLSSCDISQVQYIYIYISDGCIKLTLGDLSGSFLGMDRR